MDSLRKIMTESQRWQQGEMLLIELIRNKESNMSVEPCTPTPLDEACDDDEYNRFYVFTLIQKNFLSYCKNPDHTPGTVRGLLHLEADIASQATMRPSNLTVSMSSKSLPAHQWLFTNQHISFQNSDRVKQWTQCDFTCIKISTKLIILTDVWLTVWV